MNPTVIKNILSGENFARIVDYFKNNEDLKNQQPDNKFGRRTLSNNSHPILTEYSEILLPIAKMVFNDDSMVPSYSLFAEYSEKEISLFHHKDTNACTYTIDLVLYQDEPWGLWVENKEYILNPNEALLFMGEDQEHWRETVYNNTNKIALVFFHYVRPDHWWIGNPNWIRP